MAELEKFSSGATSSKQPMFKLIPYKALVRLCRRFELGLERHKEGSWNALSSQAALEDKDWVIERASHAVNHSLRMLAKLTGEIPPDDDDDAAAIAWAGICLCQATEEFVKPQPQIVFTSAVSGNMEIK